ncbi:MAG: helix-turn-helix domain-containing protein [Planctomycetota bacterium]|jgi:HTH-type transcriptional regulator/antitoxin HigA
MSLATTKKTKAIKVPREWINLEGNFRLRLIKTVKEYDLAMSILIELGKKARMTKLENDFFETLSILVEHYENEHCSFDTSNVSVIDILKSFMKDHGLSGADLGNIMGGDRTIASKILNNKRKLTLPQIRKLSNHFKVSPDLFF